ncbi:MAG TPA: class I SAM-dependent methyltransferase [Thermohalobaculum sp.]|nr:class I SAM-dependent methyltransferase [Thermohalobaculum sp.]
MRKSGTDKLEGAYALKTPQDNAAYYRDFSDSYDQGFAAELGYVYPRRVAELYLAEAGPGDVPVLDVGAGTGLLAEWLPGIEVDGIDISAEMLEKAAAKGLYRRRIVADLTQPLDLPADSYGALVSSGTFTHGHLGPEVLGELLRIARPGALFCLGINLAIYDTAGFAAAFARLVRQRAVTALNFREIMIYEGADHAHAQDRCTVAWFRKL